jgi:Protein of unknown function (DUF5672)
LSAAARYRSRGNTQRLRATVAASGVFLLPGLFVPTLALPEVTLACVDTRTPQLALAALQRCMAQVTFARVVLFTDASSEHALPAGVDAVHVSIRSMAEYSEFMLRGIGGHITTPFVLVVQWDGYVLNASAWTPEFLTCDYIGAPFRSAPDGWFVGNGGFSLRSARLMAAMRDPGMTISNPEDICICHENRARLERDHGIRFADTTLASRFAFERVAPSGKTFGFHGLYNMHRVLDDAALQSLMRAMPDEMVCGVDGRDFCRALIADGRFELAATLINKRRRLGLFDNRTMRLRMALQSARLLRRGETRVAVHD